MDQAVLHVVRRARLSKFRLIFFFPLSPSSHTLDTTRHASGTSCLFSLLFNFFFLFRSLAFFNISIGSDRVSVAQCLQNVLDKCAVADSIYSTFIFGVCANVGSHQSHLCFGGCGKEKKKKKKKRKAGNLGDDGQVPRRDGSTRITVMRGQIQLFERFLTNQV